MWLGGVTLAAIVSAVAPTAVRLRVGLRDRRRWPARDTTRFIASELGAGVALAALLGVFEVVLARQVDPAAVDLRHFSLHPWSVARLATLAGILAAHAAALWAGTLVCVAAIARWRLPRRWSARHAAAASLWIAPTAALAWTAAGRDWTIPAAAVLPAAVACAGAALAAPRLVPWYRRATLVSRILALFVAFLVPALLVYPTIHAFADQSLRRMIATRYAVEAMNHPQALQDRLRDALVEIDAMDLSRLAARAMSEASAGPRTDTAFQIWRRTVLARQRLTSDVEIYDGTGALVSRFALNFPEYMMTAQAPEALRGCQWETVGEAQPVGGGQEQNTLHAQRSICVDGRPVAALVVHVVFDYRALPFISASSAYFDVFSESPVAHSLEGPAAGDIDLAVYGWGLTTIYTSGTDAWRLDPETFARVYRSRDPFWTVLEKGGRPYNVYFANNRQFIYALGYRIPGLFDHLVRLAELTTFAALAYVIALIGAAAFGRIARLRTASGRSLLREIRASFYRKLFLAFVLASIVPVLTLALVIRTYFAGLLMSDIQGEASRTAAVAQRVIEESDAIARRGDGGVAPFGDDVMVWISQLIDQDVNVFYGPEIFATSERDLFASGLLPTRAPDDVYRAIILDRLPSFVTVDRIGDVPYMLAATPVTRAGRTRS